MEDPLRRHVLLFAGAALVAALGCVPSGRSSDRPRGDRLPPKPPAATDAAVITPPVDAGTTTPPPPPADAGTTPPPPRDAGTTPPPPVDAGDQCAEQPTKPPAVPTANVYYGTALPTHVPLNDDQILAIGSFNGCSGLLISYTWVLTAEHCSLRTGAQFCIGPQAANPNICFTAARVIDNPSGDMTLIELNRDARDLAPTVQPVPILHEDMNSSWLNRTAEAAGYGQQEDGGFNEREFTAEPIVSLRGDTLTIDGMGQRGVCFGDSGGPVFVIASDGSVRVAGNLSNGDGNCLGRDNYTRTDVYRSWIEGYVGPAQPPGPQPCGAVDATGNCNPDRTQATWCGTDATLQIDNCDGNRVCAFDTPNNGYRCIDAALDPCQGVTERGRCDNNRLSWCDRGRQLLVRECGACQESCIPESRDDNPHYNCLPSNCGDVDFFGRCEGNTAVWCNREGDLERRDCGQSNESCGFVDADTGYFCQ